MGKVHKKLDIFGLEIVLLFLFEIIGRIAVKWRVFSVWVFDFIGLKKFFTGISKKKWGMMVFDFIQERSLLLKTLQFRIARFEKIQELGNNVLKREEDLDFLNSACLILLDVTLGLVLFFFFQKYISILLENIENFNWLFRYKFIRV